MTAATHRSSHGTSQDEPPLRRCLIDTDADIPMRDGVRLRADIWRLDDDLPRPVVLFRTPYGKSTLALDTLRPRQCLDAGYHVVVQDTRGRFASEGEWAAMMWEQEATDTYDTVEWVAGQQWCDQKVAMAGTSYLGLVQWLGAADRPPHLRAIAPAMTTSLDLDIAETGGAFRLDQVFSWLAFMAADWLQRQVSTGAALDMATARKIGELVRDPSSAMQALPLGGAEQFALTGFPVEVDAVLSGQVRHVPAFDPTQIEIPTLSVGGWFDVFCRATVRQFQMLRAHGGGGADVRAAHRLIMGPWAHGGALPHFQGELNFGVLAGGIAARLPDKHLAFFDRQLRGDAAQDLPAVEYFLCGANEWRTAEEWPPPEAKPQRWFLHSPGMAHLGDHGRLDKQAPQTDEPTDYFLYDPLDPVPTHGGRVLYLGRLVGGPFNQRHLETRDDVLCYTSAAFATPLDIAGNVTLTLFAASTAVDTDFVAKLCDVHPDGRSVLVCDGALRTRYRNGYDRDDPLEPDVLVELRLDLGDMAWRFATGHRLRLDVTSSNFPQYDRNLNTGRSLGADAAGVPARQRIAHSVSRPSHLSLPVLGTS